MKNNRDDELKLNIDIPSKVPELVNRRIDETLKNLEGKSRRSRFRRKTAAILAACVGILCIGTFAAFGQNLSIIKSLVNLVSPSSAQNYETVKKDTLTINKSAVDNGITVTLNDMAFDGYNLIAGFSVKKDGGFGDAESMDGLITPIFHSDRDKVDIVPDKTNSTDKKNSIPNNERVYCKTENIYLSKQQDGTFKGYASFYYGENGNNIKDSYKLMLVGNQIGDAPCRWKIDTNLTQRDIYTPSVTVASSNIHKIEGGEINSVKVIKSALGSIVSLKGSYKDESQNIKTSFPGFFVIDDSGNCLNYSYLNQVILNKDNELNYDISIMKIPEGSKKLSILPFKRVSSNEASYTTDINKLPATIVMKGSEIKISDITKASGKFVMHYTVSGLMDSKRFIYFDLADKNGNKMNLNNRDVKVRNIPMDYETGVGTYEVTLKNPEDIAKVICYQYDYDTMDDYRFDIDLK